jgi:hypothetical protein
MRDGEPSLGSGTADVASYDRQHGASVQVIQHEGPSRYRGLRVAVCGGSAD